MLASIFDFLRIAQWAAAGGGLAAGWLQVHTGSEKACQKLFTISILYIGCRSKPLSSPIFQGSCKSYEFHARKFPIVAFPSDLTVTPYTLLVLQG